MVGTGVTVGFGLLDFFGVFFCPGLLFSACTPEGSGVFSAPGTLEGSGVFSAPGTLEGCGSSISIDANSPATI